MAGVFNKQREKAFRGNTKTTPGPHQPQISFPLKTKDGWKSNREITLSQVLFLVITWDTCRGYVKLKTDWPNRSLYWICVLAMHERVGT